MSAQPETLFTCDRCRDAVHTPVQNTPVHARSAGPEGWLCMVVGSDPSAPVQHLCPECRLAFESFMTQSD